jgi:hypothetical protein
MMFVLDAGGLRLGLGFRLKASPAVFAVGSLGLSPSPQQPEVVLLFGFLLSFLSFNKINIFVSNTLDVCSRVLKDCHCCS